MRRLSLILIIASLLLNPDRVMHAQDGPAFTELSVYYTFGEEITFSVRMASPLQSILLFFQVEGDAISRSFPVQADNDGIVTFQYLVAPGEIRPFSQINYWFEGISPTGERFESDHAGLIYADNRFFWQSLTTNELSISWYAGDPAFGGAAVESALTGLARIRSDLGMDFPEKMSIYIYANPTDFQSALLLGGVSWVSGHAIPDLGVVLVAIPPGNDQVSEMSRQIPHELAHIILYRITGENYQFLPTWLVEGIASQAEAVTNPDYAQVLSRASQEHTLLAMNSLCGAFPSDASNAILAYAQSDSFVHFLLRTYGVDGLQFLIHSYTDGMGCEQGTVKALGLSITDLEIQWRQEVLGEKISGAALINLLPYMVIMILILLAPLGYAGRFKIKRNRAAEDE